MNAGKIASLWLCMACVAGASEPQAAVPPASAPAAPAAQSTQAWAYIDPNVMTDGFMQAHPDLDFRQRGIDLYAKGQYEGARNALLRAARFADKPSQALLAEMYWKGHGVARDPVTAFVWMFLAAERNYADMVAWRDLYWSQLDDAQRQAARTQGAALVAEYRDSAAQPRLATVLRREARRATSGLLGHSAASNVIMVTYKGSRPVGLDPEVYYASKYWDPKEYFQLQDQIWIQQEKTRVDVGGVEAVSKLAPQPPTQPPGGP